MYAAKRRRACVCGGGVRSERSCGLSAKDNVIQYVYPTSTYVREGFCNTPDP